MALGALVVAESTLDAASLAYVYILAATALALISAGHLLTIRLSMGARPWAQLVNFFRVAAPLLGASVVAQIANRLDVFFLASYVAFADLGHYGVAIRIASVLGMVTGAFAAILTPKAATAIHDRIRLRRYLLIGGFYSVLFTAAAAALLVFIEPVASLLFGEQYRGVEEIAVVLIVTTVLRTYTIPFQAMIPCGPRPTDMVYLSVANLAVTALLLTVLVPRFGVVGGAYAVAGSSAIMFVAMGATALLTTWPKATVKMEPTG
jgi:O-antigen/teichoic acid export membrane protein